LKTILSGIESWIIPHLHKSLRKSEFVEGIPAKLFSTEDGGFNLVLAVDKIHDLVGLGSILDRVAILCERGLLKHLVGLSSYCVYDSHEAKPFAEYDVLRPRNFVGVRAASLEAFLSYISERYNLSVTILRAFNIYGPLQDIPYLVPSLLRQVTLENIVNIGDLEKTRDFLYIDDFSRALCAVLDGTHEKRLRVYNVGAGTGVKIKDLLSIVKEMARTSPKAIFDATKLREEYDYDYAVADITKIKKELGWEPKVSLEEGLALTYQWILGRSGK
jgi:UDP-glucose 4-epimerase